MWKMNFFANKRGEQSSIPILEASHIFKTLGKHSVLHDVSFSVPKNSIFGIIGPNGAGKSTLLKILIGFLHASKGNLFFNGRKIEKRSSLLKHLFGFASQHNCFYPELTVLENLAYFGKLYWLKNDVIKKRSMQLLQLVGLKEHMHIRAKNLSGGMQRKLDVACAMIHAPKILILDEPVSGLDTLSSKHLWEILQHINSLGTTIIVSTHNLSLAEEYCSDVVILDDGHVIMQTKVRDLIKKHKLEKLVVVETNPAYYDDFAFSELSYVSSMRKVDNTLHVLSLRPEQTIIDIIRIVTKEHRELVDLDIRKPNLMEVFEHIVRKESLKRIRSNHYDWARNAFTAVSGGDQSNISKLLKKKKLPDHVIRQILDEGGK